MESIRLMELLPLVEDIHVKSRKATQNTDLDMLEFLGIDKVLQSIHELLNKASKLTEINKRIKRDTKSWRKWKMILSFLMNKDSYTGIDLTN